MKINNNFEFSVFFEIFILNTFILFQLKLSILQCSIRTLLVRTVLLVWKKYGKGNKIHHVQKFIVINEQFKEKM